MTISFSQYTRAARGFHWTVAVIVLLMIPAGLIMTREGIDRTLQDTLFIFHKNTGVILFFIVLARLVYRLTHPAPPLPAFMPLWQRRVARANHALLYLLLLLMPLVGYTRVRAERFPIEGLDALGVPPIVPASKPLAEFAMTMHWYGAMLVIALAALHIGAALMHALRRDGVFQRMWP
jgi:cytochrome b561